MDESEKEWHEAHQSSSFMIEKSSSNIHQTINPLVKYSAMQAKVLHAVQYKLQQMMTDSKLTPQQFHLNHKGNLTIRMDAVDFRRLIDCESRNTVYIKKVMGELRKLSANWDSLSPDGKTGKIGFQNLFIAAEYTDAQFIFKIPEETTKHLISEKTSAVIDVLTVAQSLESKYAVFLNDLLEENSYSSNSDDFNITLTDEQLRNLLKIPYKESGKKKIYAYPQPASLIRRAIEPAVTQINKANLRFEVVSYTHAKKDQKIYWFFDVVSKKTKLLHQFAVNYSVELDVVRKALRDFGVTETAVLKIVNAISSDRELDYVQFNINIVRQKIKTKTVSSTPARLFMTCMERNREAHDEKWEDHKKQKRIDQALRKSQYEEELNKNRYIRTEELVEIRVQNELDRLKKSNLELQLHHDDFIGFLSNLPTGSAKKLRKAIEDNGLQASVLDDVLFNRYINGLVKQSVTAEDIDDYMKKVGSTLEL